MLMIASQSGESRIFENWWLSWSDTEMPDCTAQERSVMPGFLTPAEMRLRYGEPSSSWTM